MNRVNDVVAFAQMRCHSLALNPHLPCATRKAAFGAELPSDWFQVTYRFAKLRYVTGCPFRRAGNTS